MGEPGSNQTIKQQKKRRNCVQFVCDGVMKLRVGAHRCRHVSATGDRCAANLRAHFCSDPKRVKRSAVPHSHGHDCFGDAGHGHDCFGDAGWLARFGGRHPTRVGLPWEGLPHHLGQNHKGGLQPWPFYGSFRAVAPRRCDLRLRVFGPNGEDLGRHQRQLPTDLDRSHP